MLEYPSCCSTRRCRCIIGRATAGKFEDRYGSSLVDLVDRKRNGERLTAVAKQREDTNVVDLITGL